MTMSVDIIDTMLHSSDLSQHHSCCVQMLDTHNGCRDAMPNLDASRPVMNGRIAEPARPTAAIYPMQAVKSQRGRMVVEWFMRMGYIGPRRSPTNETAMAFSMSEGTTQTVTSMLVR